MDLTDFGKMPQTSPSSLAKIPRGAALLLPGLRGRDAARPGGAQRSAVEKREAGGRETPTSEKYPNGFTHFLGH